MLSWRPRTRVQYGSRLRALAAFAARMCLPTVAEAWVSFLVERMRMGATSSMRAVQDLQ